MQARIGACSEARGDSGFVIIARCDEFYPDERGGGGSSSLEEAIKRGTAYAEAGADFLLYPLASPEVHAQIIPEVPIPVCTMGLATPGTAFNISTGWGWMGAAQLHQARAKELMETGRVTMDGVLPDKAALIEQDFYDELIRRWAEDTGRKTRPAGMK